MENYHRRLKLINKLSEGLYHDIYNLISVILGQADIIKSEVHSETESDADCRMSKSIRKLSIAADEITGFVNIIKELNITYESDHDLSVNSFFSNIIFMTRGYTKKIIDDKNIYIKYEMESQPKINFRLKQQEIYDCILPVIIALYDNAENSGSIIFSCKSTSETDHLIISISKKIINKEKLFSYISDLFKEYNRTKLSGNQIQISLEPFMLTYGCNENVCYFDFAKASELFSQENVHLETVESLE